MKATITAPEGYTCAPDGFTSITYKQGDTVENNVAEWAIEAGKAEAIAREAASGWSEDAPAPKKPRGRRKKDLGAAPENKASKSLL